MEADQHSALFVDLGAIAENYRRLCQAARGAEVAPVLKGDACNLGAAVVAPVLAELGARRFFVAYLNEALALRASLAAREAPATIYVLSGLHQELLDRYRAHDLTPVLNSPSQVAAWNALARRTGESLPAALQLDIGLNRLGLDAAALDRLLAMPQAMDRLSPDLVIAQMPAANERDATTSLAHLDRFERLRARLPGFRASLANSAGVFLGRAFHLDLVRSGSALFGVNPIRGAGNPMAPAVALKSRILEVRDLGAGERFGYGGCFAAEREMRIGVLSIGATDGFSLGRGATPSRASLANGQRARVIGSGGSDTTFVDLTGLSEDGASVGQVVTLLGDGNDIERCAADAGLSEYELMARFGARVPRIYHRHPRPEARPGQCQPC